MNHKLASLLGDAQIEVLKKIEELEAVTGFPSEDVRALSENGQIARKKIKELGLDPDDTTAVELHHALLVKYENDLDELEKTLGISDDTSLKEISEKSIELASKCIKNVNLWTIKARTARNILSSVQLKNTKKLLGFRSDISMLKREDPLKILSIASVIETKITQRNIEKQLSRITAGDFGLSSPKIVSVDSLEVGRPHFLKTTSTLLVGPLTDKNVDVLMYCIYLIDIAIAQPSMNLGAFFHKIHGSLGWWGETQALVTWVDGEPISFNLFDVAKNYNSDQEFENRTHQTAANKLWQCLIGRYEEIKRQNRLAFQPQEIIDENIEMPGMEVANI